MLLLETKAAFPWCRLLVCNKFRDSFEALGDSCIRLRASFIVLYLVMSSKLFRLLPAYFTFVLQIDFISNYDLEHVLVGMLVD